MQDLNIWWHPNLLIYHSTSLRDVLAQGSKYPEPKSINWKHDFEIPIEIQLYYRDTIFTSNFFSNEQLIFLQLWVTCSDVYIKIIFNAARYSSGSSEVHILYGCLEWNDYVKFKSFFLYIECPIGTTSIKGTKNKCDICQSHKYGEHCIHTCNCSASQR
jgi:hypothetical protein